MPKQAFNYALFLFTYYGHAGAFATYASLLFAARGMSAAQIGVLMSLIQVMRMVGPNLWGWVADHTRRRVMVLRMTGLAALVAFTGIVYGHTFAQLFAAMVLLNLFTSAQGPVSEGLMLSEMQGDLSHYGRLRMWGSLGFIVTVMLTGYGLEWWGVDALPWIAGAMLVCVLAVSLRMREAAPVHGAAPAPALLPILRQPAVLALFGSAALMVAAHTSLYVYYSLYLARAGYGKPVIGAMWSLGVMAEIVFFYFQARVFTRYGARRVMMFAFGVALLRFVVIGAGAQSLVLLVLAQLLHALTFAAHHSACVHAMQRWFSGPLQARGQALYISIAYGIGGSAGGLFMAWCWEGVGPQAVYFAAALLAGVGAAVGALSYRWQAAPAVLDAGTA